MDTGLRRYDGARNQVNSINTDNVHKTKTISSPLSFRVIKTSAGADVIIAGGAGHLEPLHHCEFNGGFLELALPQVGIALGITDRQGRNKSPHVQFII